MPTQTTDTGDAIVKVVYEKEDLMSDQNTESSVAEMYCSRVENK